MKHERYYRAGEAIVGAFVKGNLDHGSICSCAVGNMVQAATGIERPTEWYWATQNLDRYHRHILATGYDLGEIMEIEGAFEGRNEFVRDVGGCPTHDLNYRTDPDSFLGATAALETLHSLETWDERPINTETLELAEVG